ncbi:PIH1 domain-containing protein 1 [Homalodisca vitripennis]|nr:PIH1 domain-containing protein 1 [Homalodisca vitripennis]
MEGRNKIMLDVDPSIMEKNLLLEDLKDDELDSLISTLKDQQAKVSSNDQPWKLVKPSPGFVVKTRTEGGEKIFLNICHTDEIPAPQDICDDKLLEIMKSDEPSTYRLPLSIGDLHEEPDKSGKPSSVYDIAINSDFFHKIESNMLFRSFLLQVALEGVADKYNKHIDYNVPLMSRPVFQSTTSLAPGAAYCQSGLPGSQPHQQSSSILNGPLHLPLKRPSSPYQPSPGSTNSFLIMLSLRNSLVHSNTHTTVVSVIFTATIINEIIFGVHSPCQGPPGLLKCHNIHAGRQPNAQPPTWRTRVSLLVWLLPHEDLSGKGGPTISYATAGIALEVVGACKPTRHIKAKIPSDG